MHARTRAIEIAVLSDEQNDLTRLRVKRLRWPPENLDRYAKVYSPV